jgi:predicted ATPase
MAATLEDCIVKGKFNIEKNGNIRFVMDEDLKLDFHLSSSTAKSLFGLDYLLRNKLKKGCILIIDEPEQNLHPDNQRYIARLLCKLANAGVNVIISTHSDYIVREINNLIILANRFKGYEKLMKEYGYEEEELIAKENVKGYIFQEHMIDEVDGEGMKIDVFDQVINKMNEASDDIYYTYREVCDDHEQDSDREI